MAEAAEQKPELRPLVDQMKNKKPARGADTRLYFQCLASIEAERIAIARQQASRIEDAALRTIAEDQIRIVIEINECLAHGDTAEARRLSRSLIGGIRKKHESSLEDPSVSHIQPSSSGTSENEPLATTGEDRPAPSDFADFPPEIRTTLGQLTQSLQRARMGRRDVDFSPAVLLQLGAIAHRAWGRPRFAQNLSPLRATATEIRIVGMCLRQRIEGDGRRLSIEDLSREGGLSRGSVCVAVRNLRQFLLRGSGWRMVGDTKSGFALEPEAPTAFLADQLHDTGSR
jgi:hypothetical protein